MRVLGDESRKQAGNLQEIVLKKQRERPSSLPRRVTPTFWLAPVPSN